MDWAPSHLETDWRLTPSLSASSSWDQPAFFLKSMILSARIMPFSFRPGPCPALFSGLILPEILVACYQFLPSICQPAVAMGGKSRYFTKKGADPSIRSLLAHFKSLVS